VLDYDGNLFDTAFVGAMVALLHTTIPAERFGLGDDYQLPVNHFPVSCTAVKIGDAVLVDPILDEEKLADARLTITTDENGNIRAIQKGLSGGFTIKEILYVARISNSIGVKLRELILE
jgi:exosome complex component RRP42